jgi:hypothetical protein
MTKVLQIEYVVYRWLRSKKEAERQRKKKVINKNGMSLLYSYNYSWIVINTYTFPCLLSQSLSQYRKLFLLKTVRRFSYIILNSTIWLNWYLHFSLFSIVVSEQEHTLVITELSAPQAVRIEDDVLEYSTNYTELWTFSNEKLFVCFFFLFFCFVFFPIRNYNFFLKSLYNNIFHSFHTARNVLFVIHMSNWQVVQVYL